MSDSSGGAVGYDRVTLKLSGELLQGEKDYGLAPTVLEEVADQLAAVNNRGVRLTVVIGGGNIYRGLSASEQGIDRETGDYMGMLATVLNGLGLKNALEKQKCDVYLYSALEIDEIADSYDREQARDNLSCGGINIAVAGTGHPYFTTDTAAVLRALESDSEVLLKATKVDGVFDRDPEEFPKAEKYDRLTYSQVITRELEVMDFTATSLCRANELPVVVFNLKKRGNLSKVLAGDKVGTLIEGAD